MQVILEKKDYVVLDELLKISSSITNLYQELCELEINNQKNSEVYAKNLDFLKIALEVERHYYQEINLDSSLMEAYSKDLYRRFATYVTDFDALAIGDYTKLSIRRVLNHFNKELKGDPSLEDNAFYAKDEFYFDAVSEIIDKEFLLTFLSILTNRGHILGFDINKREKIKAKYFLSLLYSCVESEMLANSFNVSEDVIIHSHIYANIYGCQKDYLELANYYAYNPSLYEIRELLSFNDLYSNASSIYLRLCLLMGYLSICNDETMADINNYFHNLVRDNSFEEREIVGIIKQAFIGLKQIKNYQKMLKLAE